MNVRRLMGMLAEPMLTSECRGSENLAVIFIDFPGIGRGRLSALCLVFCVRGVEDGVRWCLLPATRAWNLCTPKCISNHEDFLRCQDSPREPRLRTTEISQIGTTEAYYHQLTGRRRCLWNKCSRRTIPALQRTYPPSKTSMFLATHGPRHE